MRTIVLATALLLTVSLAWGDDKVRSLIRDNKLDQLKVLFAAKGFGINDDQGNGYSALHLAVESNNGDIADYLIQNGADVNVDFHKTTTTFQSNSGPEYVTASTLTPLALAVQKNLASMATRLLRAGAVPDAAIDPRAFTSKDEPVTVLKKAVELSNGAIVTALLTAGAKIESSPGRGDGSAVLDRSIELWRNNYIANKITIDAQNFTVTSVAAGGAGQLIQGATNVFGFLAGLNFSKQKVLESSGIIRGLYVALKDGAASSRRLREIYLPRKWDTLTALLMRSSAGEFQDRTIEVDLALILGDFDKLQQAMADNAPISAMTMIYLIQYDRVREFRFLQSLGIPYPYLLQPVSLDREVFPNYLVFAYSQGSPGILQYFQRLLSLSTVAAEAAQPTLQGSTP